MAVDIARLRLHNQLLRGGRAGAGAAEVVRRLGAVQAQDYGGAAWAVAQRTAGLTRADVDQALTSGSILRTHVLRPTWHLVAPEDIRWMLALTAPRVRALAAFGDRESGLDDELLARSNRVIAAALAGGQPLTRVELGAALGAAGIDVAGTLALGRVVMRAELDGVVCSGGLRGRQHTYALLDERVPATPVRDREAALAELAARYFAGHGPATIRDFAWWSGLSVTEATTGTRTAQPALATVTSGSTTYWYAPVSRQPRRPAAVDAHLLPNFDEYTVAYADRSLVVDAADIRRLESRDDSIFTNVVLVDGHVAGTWRRQLGATEVRVVVKRLRALGDDEVAAVASAVERFARFLGLRGALELHDAPRGD